MSLRIETKDSEYRDGALIGAYWNVEAHHYNGNASIVWFSHVGHSESDYDGDTRFSVPNNDKLERAIKDIPIPTLKKGI